MLTTANPFNSHGEFRPSTSRARACSAGTVRFAQIYPTVSPPLMIASDCRCGAIPYMVKGAWLMRNPLWRHHFPGLNPRNWTRQRVFRNSSRLFHDFLISSLMYKFHSLRIVRHLLLLALREKKIIVTTCQMSKFEPFPTSIPSRHWLTRTLNIVEHAI